MLRQRFPDAAEAKRAITTILEIVPLTLLGLSLSPPSPAVFEDRHESSGRTGSVGCDGSAAVQRNEKLISDANTSSFWESSGRRPGRGVGWPDYFQPWESCSWTEMVSRPKKLSSAPGLE